MCLKAFLFITLLVTLFSGGIAQESPPPPLIYAPPTHDEVKEFVSEECGYAISFAGELQVARRPDVCLYIGAKRKGSSATFRVIRFSEDDLTKHPPVEVFERVKAAYLWPNNFQVTNEKEVQVYGEKGVDFSFSDGIQYRRVRAFIKDKVLYEFYIDVTNWHILTEHNPETAKAFEAEVSRFFSSLRFLPKK